MGPQIISWGVDYPDPADALHFIYDSKARGEEQRSTPPTTRARQMDKLLADAAEVRRTRSVRAAAIRKALRLAAVDVPYIPIWYQDVAMAVSNKLRYRDFGTWYLYHALGAWTSRRAKRRGRRFGSPTGASRLRCHDSLVSTRLYVARRLVALRRARRRDLVRRLQPALPRARGARSRCCSAARPIDARRRSRQIRAEYHLDDPFLVQVREMGRGGCALDFGRSIRTNEPVVDGIAERLR